MDKKNNLPFHDGIVLPFYSPFNENPQKGLQRLKEFPTRPSDVLVCGSMKSGNHWCFEIVALLLSGSLDFSLVNFDNHLDIADFDELKERPDPRVLHTHLPYRCFPGHEQQKNYKVIHIMRNPKDRLVSLYHYIQGKKNNNYHANGNRYIPHGFLWERFFDRMVMKPELESYGNWFESVKEAEIQKQLKNLHIVHYEDLLKNFNATVRKLADYLQIERSESFLTELEHKCSFDNMKRNKPDTTIPYDAHGRSTLYRKGVIGDWKSYFTVFQNEKFDEMYKTKMADSKLQFIYE